MNNCVIEFFSVTTAEDENNYFSGEIQSIEKANWGAFLNPSPGMYRVIDGNLYQIISGLGPEEVRRKITENSKSTSE